MMLPQSPAPSPLFPPSSQSPGKDRKTFHQSSHRYGNSEFAYSDVTKGPQQEKSRGVTRVTAVTLYLLEAFFARHTDRRNPLAGHHRQVRATTPVFCASSGDCPSSVIDWFSRVHFPGARQKPLGTKQQGEPALKWRCLTEQREKFAITTTVRILAFETCREARALCRK